MHAIAALIDESLMNRQNASTLADLSKRVSELMQQYPLFAEQEGITAS
jgi:glycine/serine hydroxymethyltransferase